MNQDQADREQQQINDAVYAKQLRDNPLMQSMFVYLKAGYVDKLTKIKKGRHYEAQLKDIHDSLQNLARIEGYFQKCIDDGKVVQDKQKKRLFSK
jgi:hypothetical protein